MLDTVALSQAEAHEKAKELANMFRPEADVGVEVMEFKTYGPAPEFQIWIRPDRFERPAELLPKFWTAS